MIRAKEKNKKACNNQKKKNPNISSQKFYISRLEQEGHGRKRSYKELISVSKL